MHLAMKAGANRLRNFVTKLRYYCFIGWEQ